MPSLSATVLARLACPVCRQTLQLQISSMGEAVECTGCGRTYPVMDGIPVLIPERATSPNKL